MLTIGLDVHQAFTAACVLDEGGRVIENRSIRGDWRKVVAWIAKLSERVRICFEASVGYGPLHDALARVSDRVVVAHPSQLRLIFRSKQKHDRADAKKLATLLFLDQVPPVHVPASDVRGWRSLIEHRRRLIDRRTKTKNGLRAALRSAGIRPERGGHWLWTQAGRRWLAEVELPSDAEQCRREVLIAELEHFEKLVAIVTKQLDQLAKDHQGIALLMTIPGVGPRTAEAVIAYIDDPRRFNRVRSIGSYFGLIPSQDQSAGKNRMGRITKTGPGTVRRLLVEAAWCACRWCEEAKAFTERITQGEPARRKIATVALAHKLARMMLAMLRTGETCRWSTRRKAT